MAGIKDRIKKYVSQQGESEAKIRETLNKAIDLFIEVVEERRRSLVEIIEKAYNSSDAALQEQVSLLGEMVVRGEKSEALIDKQAKEALSAMVHKPVVFRFTFYKALANVARGLIPVPGAAAAGLPANTPKDSPMYLLGVCETPDEQRALVELFKAREVRVIKGDDGKPFSVSEFFSEVALKDNVEMSVSTKTLNVVKKVDAMKGLPKLAKARELIEAILAKQADDLQALLAEIESSAGTVNEMLEARRSAAVDANSSEEKEEEGKLEAYFIRVEEAIQRCLPFLEKEEEEAAAAAAEESEANDEKRAVSEEEKAAKAEAKSLIAEFSAINNSLSPVGPYTIPKCHVTEALEACFQLQVIRLEKK